jgi:uncharacterized RDD family membrane protein YckC
VRRRTEAVPAPTHHRAQAEPAASPAVRPSAAAPVQRTGTVDRPTGLARPAAASAEAGSKAAPTVPLAGWWRRGVAAAIDYLIEVTLVVAVLLVVARGFVERLRTAYGDWLQQTIATWPAGPASLPDLPDQLVTQLSWLSTMIAVATLIYAIVFLGAWGATPGQRLLGLRVIPLPEGSESITGKLRQVDAGQAAVRLSWTRAVLRGLIWSILLSGSYLTLVLIFSVLMPLWQSRRQTVPDLMAQTIVIKRR